MNSIEVDSLHEHTKGRTSKVRNHCGKPAQALMGIMKSGWSAIVFNAKENISPVGVGHSYKRFNQIPVRKPGLV